MEKTDIKIKKNIAVVINSLRLGGGAERVASVVGSELNKKGYNVSFLVFKDARTKYEYKGKHVCIGENIEVKSSLGAFFAIFKRAKRIKEYCSENDIDTTISFMEEANFACMISKILFKNKAKIILSVREDPRYNKSKKVKILMKLLHKKADVVVANSKASGYALNNFFNLKNVITIYNPIDFNRINKLKEEAIKEDFEKIFLNSDVFINIGRFTKPKAQWRLIRAFSEVARYQKSAKLVILGEGEFKPRLENLIKKMNLDNNVFLIERQENIFSFLKKADCFIFSSLWEGLPNTVIEAVACELPVISTDCISGPREILAPNLDINKEIEYPYDCENGVLVKNLRENGIFDNVDKTPLSSIEKGLANAMISFLKNKKETKQFGLERFGLKNIINQWEEII